MPKEGQRKKRREWLYEMFPKIVLAWVLYTKRIREQQPPSFIEETAKLTKIRPLPRLAEVEGCSQESAAFHLAVFPPKPVVF